MKVIQIVALPGAYEFGTIKNTLLCAVCDNGAVMCKNVHDDGVWRYITPNFPSRWQRFKTWVSRGEL